MTGERGREGGSHGGVGRRALAWGQGGGIDGKRAVGGRGDLDPLPLAPLPRALPAGERPVPLGELLARDCLPPDRLPLPFAGEGMGGLVGAGRVTSR